MDLIDDYELSCLGAQEGIRVVQPSLIGQSLEVEVDGFTPAVRRDAAGHGSLANVTRPEQQDTRRGSQPTDDQCLLATQDRDNRVLNVTRSISGNN